MIKAGIFINEFYQKSFDSILREITEKEDLKLFCLNSQSFLMPENISVYEDEKLDFLMVFGGDGTILSAVDFALQSSAPIFGINIGRLGFLSDISVNEYNKYHHKLMNKQYQIIKRMLIQVSVVRKGVKIFSGFALNDAVVYKGLVSRLINMKIFCNGNFVLETRCDGMISATPTGSTAYSLSAGGPILIPEMEAHIISPLCPHVLSVRPMVFSGKDKLRFKMTRVFNETVLQLDGKNVLALFDGDNVMIKNAKEKVGFVSVSGKSFYRTLRKKLHMGKI